MKRNNPRDAAQPGLGGDSATDDPDGSNTANSAGLLVAARQRATTDSRRIERWVSDLRARVFVVGLAFDIFERDRSSAGTLLGSAIAFRLFLFFVPFVLLVVGFAGLIGAHLEVESVSSAAGVSGTLAREMDRTFDQGTATPWIALGVGLFGIGTAGRALTRALVLSSALSWHLDGRQRIQVRVSGLVVGITVAMSVIAAVLQRVREAAGIAVVSVSIVAVVATYFVLWSLLLLVLPRNTSDPAAVMPGAAVMATVVSILHLSSQLVLSGRIANASSLYGALGVTIVSLGWFFIIGRSLAATLALNAVVFEEVGSLSEVVFGLPVLRRLPRRFPSIARFFDLGAPSGGANTE